MKGMLPQIRIVRRMDLPDRRTTWPIFARPTASGAFERQGLIVNKATGDLFEMGMSARLHYRTDRIGD